MAGQRPQAAPVPHRHRDFDGRLENTAASAAAAAATAGLARLCHNMYVTVVVRYETQVLVAVLDASAAAAAGADGGVRVHPLQRLAGSRVSGAQYRLDVAHLFDKRRHEDDARVVVADDPHRPREVFLGGASRPG